MFIQQFFRALAVGCFSKRCQGAAAESHVRQLLTVGRPHWSLRRFPISVGGHARTLAGGDIQDEDVRRLLVQIVLNHRYSRAIGREYGLIVKPALPNRRYGLAVAIEDRKHPGVLLEDVGDLFGFGGGLGLGLLVVGSLTESAGRSQQEGGGYNRSSADNRDLISRLHGILL